MSFINQPLITRQNITIYKLWLIQFNLDIDCLSVIKQLTYQVCMKRKLVIPNPLDINKNIIYKPIKSFKFFYINNEGIVFKLRGHQPVKDGSPIPALPPKLDIKIERYHSKELYTHTRCKKNRIDVNNVESLLVSYFPCHMFEIDLKLSGVSDIIINDVTFTTSDYHQLFNSDLVFI